MNADWYAEGSSRPPGKLERTGHTGLSVTKIFM